MDIIQSISKIGIVPVIKINDPAAAVPLARALLDGGIRAIEITFRTAAAKEAIENVVKQAPDMLVGAGTVTTEEQLKDAEAVGAKFIVSPGLDSDILYLAQKRELPILPGVLTPSEILTGLKFGIEVFKFFPAENFGGLATVKALAAPFGNVKFVPTGGINEKNVAEYWKFEKVLAVGGSWMASEKLINDGDFAEITRRAKAAIELKKSVRGEV
ncbi:MAG: bifunctional 4-hydroxy-2-oxoglutarate aldolase/2-dehydro-3-deoxy-phosphogluconate aldolase [Clostridiales bacterium]|jgi:2-dehydro-3-deoxyphosphogluconate aldolase/(4S)-4-hydroxy-2-oxoglutarate aldolase|nr:bifunctional 4-hydroxy-2-oxoglutarate aldolase/2-dehydro-3-deoxy-phosphogluconate aldolase [Clostridiales bacterium]